MAKQSVKTERKLQARIIGHENTMKSNPSSKLKYHKPGSQNRKK